MNLIKKNNFKSHSIFYNPNYKVNLNKSYNRNDSLNNSDYSIFKSNKY